MKEQQFAEPIGISPSGDVWVAYSPDNVAPMRRRLANLWRRHRSELIERSKGFRAVRR